METAVAEGVGTLVCFLFPESGSRGCPESCQARLWCWDLQRPKGPTTVVRTKRCYPQNLRSFASGSGPKASISSNGGITRIYPEQLPSLFWLRCPLSLLTLPQLCTLLAKVGKRWSLQEDGSPPCCSHNLVLPALTVGGRAELLGRVTGHKAGLDGNGRSLVGGEQGSRGRAARRWAGFRASPAR